MSFRDKTKKRLNPKAHEKKEKQKQESKETKEKLAEQNNINAALQNENEELKEFKSLIEKFGLIPVVEILSELQAKNDSLETYKEKSDQKIAELEHSIEEDKSMLDETLKIFAAKMKNFNTENAILNGKIQYLEVENAEIAGDLFISRAKEESLKEKIEILDKENVKLKENSKEFKKRAEIYFQTQKKELEEYKKDLSDIITDKAFELINDAKSPEQVVQALKEHFAKSDKIVSVINHNEAEFISRMKNFLNDEEDYEEGGELYNEFKLNFSYVVKSWLNDDYNTPSQKTVEIYNSDYSNDQVAVTPIEQEEYQKFDNNDHHG